MAKNVRKRSKRSASYPKLTVAQTRFLKKAEQKDLASVYISLDKAVSELTAIRDLTLNPKKKKAANKNKKTVTSMSSLMKDSYDENLYAMLLWELEKFQSRLRDRLARVDLLL